MSKKRMAELVMACILLICIYVLSGEAAVITERSDTGNTIVIDAGHGGSDPGMIGIDGLEEKTINLEIAKKLQAVLEQYGFRVILTRKTDDGLYEEALEHRKLQDMQKRISIIREAKPRLTLSIHQNSYSDPAVRGPQVFYYQGSEEGKKLAVFLQNKLNDCLNQKNPRKEKGNQSYYLLKKSEGLCALIECGFLTNPEEARLLSSGDYQQKVAEGIAQGVRLYLSNNGDFSETDRGI